MRSYPEIEKFGRFVFRFNNYCNLHCEHCSTLDDIPIRPDSPYPDRRKKWEMPLSTIERFCKRFEGIAEKTTHIRLFGGEFTALPIKKMEAIIETFHSYDRRMWLLTNGFNLLGLDKTHLNMMHNITLDDHGINHDHILNCMKHLKRVYKGKAHVIRMLYHWNLETAIKHELNYGKTCRPLSELVKGPTFYRGVIYQCCNGPSVEAFQKNIKMNVELRRAGWTLDNPDVLETLNNWKNTLPQYVLDQCRYSCWRPHFKVGEKKRITLKKNDVIKKIQTVKKNI